MRNWISPIAGIASVVPIALLSSSQARAVPVPEQTPVKVKLLQPLQSGHDRKGDRVRFALAEAIMTPQHAVLIPKGTPVLGTITRSTGRRMFGQPGKLEFTIDYIKVSEHVQVPLRSSATVVRGRNNAGPAIGAAVLVTPIAVLVKGREVTLKPGQEFTVYVNQTTEIPGTTPALAATPASQLDKSRLSLFRFKNGDTLTGTLVGFKDGAYTIATDVGQISVSQDKIESISEKR
jgi:hypothetical protein